MIKQIRLLTGVLMKNFLGINQLRYGKDKKERYKYIGLMLVWIYLFAMVAWLVVKMIKAYCQIGMGFVVPLYIYTLISLLALVFTFLKAGNVLFSLKDYDMLIALPVSKTAIVVSRFLTMYVNSLLVSMIIIIPGMGTYVYYERPDISFYLISFLAIVFMPLFPLTIASILGALITAISSRMKNRNIAEIVLTFGFVAVVFYLSSRLEQGASSFTPAMMANLAETITGMIKKIYIPAGWYAEALNGNVTSLILLIIVPLVIFIIFAFCVGHLFQSICSAINAVTSRNNYKLEKLESSSVIKALWKKELKRYFSSSVYVTNTLVGCIISAAMCIALLVVGKDKVLGLMGMNVFADKVDGFVPFLIALMFGIMPTTACSISIEGKNMWQLRILPVESIQIYKSKILLNLTITLPFYLVSVVAAMLAIKPGIYNGIMIVLLPLAEILFVTVLGVLINLKFPNLKWDREVDVVKQGMSVMLTMICGMSVVILPLVVMYLLKTVPVEAITGATTIVLAAGTVVTYYTLSKKELIFIQ